MINCPPTPIINRALALETHPVRALGLFHGRNDPNMGSFIESIADRNSWYFVDCNPKCDPDLICDVTDRGQMAYLPDQYFDVIATLHFPIGLENNVHRYTDMLLSIRRCLKPGGCIFIFEMPRGIHYFINNQQLRTIIELYVSVLDLETRKEIASVMNLLNSSNPLYPDVATKFVSQLDIRYTTMNLSNIFHLIHYVPTIRRFYRARNELYIEFSIKYLENLGYEVIDCNSFRAQVKLR